MAATTTWQNERCNRQNNNSARVFYNCVHLVVVLCETTTWNHQNLWGLRMETATANYFNFHLELNAALIRYAEAFQIFDHYWFGPRQFLGSLFSSHCEECWPSERHHELGDWKKLERSKSGKCKRIEPDSKKSLQSSVQVCWASLHETQRFVCFHALRLCNNLL